jgi:hypothetical protein
MLAVEVCFGQASTAPEIVTDRPDITESSIVIPVGSVQVENGVTWSIDRGAHSIDFSETLVRVGLLGRTEFRLTPPNYVGQFSGSQHSSALAEPSVGLKEQLGPLPGGFDLSVIVGSNLPIGADKQNGHGFSPFVKFPWSRELTKGWSVGGMQSFFHGTEQAPHKETWESTFYVEREFAKRSDAFIEYGADYGRGEESRQLLHIGAAHRITPTQQIDFHIGFGVSRGAPRHFFAVGYSLRIDHLFHRGG